MSPSQVLPLVKKYMVLCVSHSFPRLILEPTRKAEHTKTLIDYIIHSPEKMIQIDLIEIGLSNLELILSFLKLNEHYRISLSSMKNFSDELFFQTITQ